MLAITTLHESFEEKKHTQKYTTSWRTIIKPVRTCSTTADVLRQHTFCEVLLLLATISTQRTIAV